MKYTRVVRSIIVELAVIFSAIQISKYVPTNSIWTFIALVVLVLALVLKHTLIEK